MQKENYVPVKSYERVEWAYPEGDMGKLGFMDKWMKWIMKCVKCVKYFVCYNGNMLESFSPTCGLRQGDPRAGPGAWATGRRPRAQPRGGT